MGCLALPAIPAPRDADRHGPVLHEQTDHVHEEIP
jgi:hypothetical protein